MRVMNRIKALYRSWGIPCTGTQVYTRRHRELWLNKIQETGVHRRAELFYQELDGLQSLRLIVRRELLTESRKIPAVKLLRQIPFIGPLRAAQLVALMQTPQRFRSKRQLWTYSGLAVVTHDSAQYRYVDGQLQRCKKPQKVRGLNQNHNHTMKEIFKSAALSSALRPGPFQDFYLGLLAKGMKPEMARVLRSLRHSSRSETISIATMRGRDRFSLIVEGPLESRQRHMVSRKSVRSGLMFRHTRGISASAATIQFVGAMRRTMGGGLIRTKPSSIASRLDRTICGSSISRQANGRRFWVR